MRPKQDIETLATILNEGSWPIVIYDARRGQLHWNGEIHRMFPFTTKEELHKQAEEIAGTMHYTLVTIG